MLFTGQETTSNQLSFTLHEILRHPDVEDRYAKKKDDSAEMSRY